MDPLRVSPSVQEQEVKERDSKNIFEKSDIVFNISIYLTDHERGPFQETCRFIAKNAQHEELFGRVLNATKQFFPNYPDALSSQLVKLQVQNSHIPTLYHLAEELYNDHEKSFKKIEEVDRILCLILTGAEQPGFKKFYIKAKLLRAKLHINCTLKKLTYKKVFEYLDVVFKSDLSTSQERAYARYLMAVLRVSDITIPLTIAQAADIFSESGDHLDLPLLEQANAKFFRAILQRNFDVAPLDNAPENQTQGLFEAAFLSFVTIAQDKSNKTAQVDAKFNVAYFIVRELVPADEQHISEQKTVEYLEDLINSCFCFPTIRLRAKLELAHLLNDGRPKRDHDRARVLVQQVFKEMQVYPYTAICIARYNVRLLELMFNDPALNVQAQGILKSRVAKFLYTHTTHLNEEIADFFLQVSCEGNYLVSTRCSATLYLMMMAEERRIEREDNHINDQLFWVLNNSDTTIEDQVLAKLTLAKMLYQGRPVRNNLKAALFFQEIINDRLALPVQIASAKLHLALMRMDHETDLINDLQAVNYFAEIDGIDAKYYLALMLSTGRPAEDNPRAALLLQEVIRDSDNPDLIALAKLVLAMMRAQNNTYLIDDSQAINYFADYLNEPHESPINRANTKLALALMGEQNRINPRDDHRTITLANEVYNDPASTKEMKADALVLKVRMKAQNRADLVTINEAMKMIVQLLFSQYVAVSTFSLFTYAFQIIVLAITTPVIERVNAIYTRMNF